MRAQRSARPRHAGPSRPGRLCGTTPGCTLRTGRRSGWPAGSTSNRSPTTSPFVRSSSVSNHWGSSQTARRPQRPRRIPGSHGLLSRDRAGARRRCRRPQRPYPAGTSSGAVLRGVLDRLWTAATRHPFLDAVRAGTITDSAFDRWLGQDALFVGDLLTFQARLLARAPRPAQGVLAGGCVALVAELDWFEVQAARRGIGLGQPVLPATFAYGELRAAGCRALRGGGDGAVGPRTGVPAGVGLRCVDERRSGMKDTISHYVPPHSPLTSIEPQAFSNNLTMPSALRPSSREIVDGARPSRAAIDRIDSPAVRASAISSRSAIDR